MGVSNISHKGLSRCGYKNKTKGQSKKEKTKMSKPSPTLMRKFKCCLQQLLHNPYTFMRTHPHIYNITRTLKTTQTFSFANSHSHKTLFPTWSSILIY